MILKYLTMMALEEKIYFYRMDTNSTSNRYDENIILCYEYFYNRLYELNRINKLNLSNYFDYFKIKNLNIIFTNYFRCNRSLSLVKKLCNSETYKDAIHQVRVQELPKRRKVMIFLARLKLYILIKVFYRILS